MVVATSSSSALGMYVSWSGELVCPVQCLITRMVYNTHVQDAQVERKMRYQAATA